MIYLCYGKFVKYDKKLAINKNVINVVMNIIKVVTGANINSFGYIDLADAEMRITMIILMAKFLIYMTTKLKTLA